MEYLDLGDGRRLRIGKRLTNADAPAPVFEAWGTSPGLSGGEAMVVKLLRCHPHEHHEAAVAEAHLHHAASSAHGVATLRTWCHVELPAAGLAGMEPGRYVALVMPKGVPLVDHLNRTLRLDGVERKLTLDERCHEAARIMRSVADTVVELADMGIAHGDIKPDNIVMGPDGQPQLIDFGLSRHVSTDLVTGALVAPAAWGTRGCQSPELVAAIHASEQAWRVYRARREAGVDEPMPARPELDVVRSDLWSVGMTLAHLAFGVIPLGKGAERESEEPDPRRASLETAANRDRAARLRLGDSRGFWRSVLRSSLGEDGERFVREQPRALEAVRALADPLLAWRPQDRTCARYSDDAAERCRAGQLDEPHARLLAAILDVAESGDDEAIAAIDPGVWAAAVRVCDGVGGFTMRRHGAVLRAAIDDLAEARAGAAEGDAPDGASATVAHGAAPHWQTARMVGPVRGAGRDGGAASSASASGGSVAAEAAAEAADSGTAARAFGGAVEDDQAKRARMAPSAPRSAPSGDAAPAAVLPPAREPAQERDAPWWQRGRASSTASMLGNMTLSPSHKGARARQGGAEPGPPPALGSGPPPALMPGPPPALGSGRHGAVPAQRLRAAKRRRGDDKDPLEDEDEEDEDDEDHDDDDEEGGAEGRAP